MGENKFTALLLVASFLIVLGVYPQSVDNDTEKTFYEKYSNWKALMASPKSKFLSDTTGVTTSSYEEIVKLGPGSLPYIFKEISADHNLWYAVRKITKKWFTKDERDKVKNEIVSLYVYWYHTGRKQTPQRFEKLYAEYKGFKSQHRDKDAQETYQKIKDLGIDALPLLADKMSKGEEGLEDAFSYLSDEPVNKDNMDKYSKSKNRREAYVKWWQENKEKWLIKEVEEQKN